MRKQHVISKIKKDTAEAKQPVHILTQQEKHKQMYNKYVQNNISTVENLKKTSNTVNIIFAHFKVKKKNVVNTKSDS